MPVRETSLESFYWLKEEGILGERQMQIYRAIVDNPEVSDRELCGICSLPINSVTPRRNELEELGLIESAGVKINSNGRSCHSWIATEYIKEQVRERKVLSKNKITCPYCQGKGWINNGQLRLKTW